MVKENARTAAVLSRHETKSNRAVAAHKGMFCRARAERLSHLADDQRGLEILGPVPASRRQQVVDEPACEGVSRAHGEEVGRRFARPLSFLLSWCS